MYSQSCGPGAWDQPWIANELVHLGIELELV